MKKLLVTLSCLWPAMAAAQALNPADILKPLANDWPTYSGDYSGKRYSTLTQVNQSTVKNLTLAWTSRLASGPGGGGGGGRGGGRFGGGGAPTIIGGEGTADAGGQRRNQHQGRRSSKSMASCTSPRPTTPGPWTLATATNCGTTSGRPRAARTSAIAAWACGATGCTWRRPTITWSGSTRRTGKERWHKEIASFESAVLLHHGAGRGRQSRPGRHRRRSG